MKSIVITFTEEEALSLRNLLDIAVKAGGMRAAEFALPLDRKIMAAAQDQLSSAQAESTDKNAA